MCPVPRCLPPGWLRTCVAELGDWLPPAAGIAFSLHSLSQKNRIVVAAGSEQQKKKRSGKEK